MTTGTVKFFNSDRGYGFITPDDGGPDAPDSHALISKRIPKGIQMSDFIH